ncbi:7874_t:CDS:2 [Rhizophagus irregularis]|nr:7874_t:CDS:2 [Rhizophagus irregularis]
MNSWNDNDSLQIHVIDEGIFAFDYGRNLFIGNTESENYSYSS